MPRKSRLKRIGEWFVTLFRSIGAVLYPPNIKNAFRSVTKNWKEYICFYLAALVMTAGFWTVALCSDANMRVAQKAVAEIDNMGTYISEMTCKFITGPEPLTNFDTYMDTLQKMGIENLIQLYQDAYDQFNSRGN